MYVIDAEDRERLSEGWEVFGTTFLFFFFLFHPCIYLLTSNADSVLSNPQILGVPLLLLANKQDSPQSLSVDEIRHDYEDWYQRKLESARRTRYGSGLGEDGFGGGEAGSRRERMASLDVLGVSALEGWVRCRCMIDMRIESFFWVGQE